MTYDPTAVGRERNERERADSAEAECDRLRELLSIARDGLRHVAATYVYGDTSCCWHITETLRRSDPDAQP